MISFLDEGLKKRIGCENGMPRLSKNFETEALGLYIAGALAEGSHGPAQRFLIGNRHAAIAVGRVISAFSDVKKTVLPVGDRS